VLALFPTPQRGHQAAEVEGQRRLPDRRLPSPSVALSEPDRPYSLSGHTTR
jgi:hypothetical protein